jgi:hypothetical protein
MIHDITESEKLRNELSEHYDLFSQSVCYICRRSRANERSFVWMQQRALHVYSYVRHVVAGDINLPHNTVVQHSLVQLTVKVPVHVRVWLASTPRGA